MRQQFFALISIFILMLLLGAGIWLFLKSETFNGSSSIANPPPVVETTAPADQ